MRLLPPFKSLSGKKGRKTYASLAGATAFVFSVLFTIAQSLLSSIPLVFENFLYVLLATPSAFVAAYISWPKSSSRSRWRMAVAGLSTVALAFLFIGIAIGIVFTISNPSDLTAIIAMPLAVVFFGTLFTLGIPYILGVMLSLLFANADSESEEN